MQMLNVAKSLKYSLKSSPGKRVSKFLFRSCSFFVMSCRKFVKVLFLYFFVKVSGEF